MTESRPARFEWIGGALPLDFVNTVSWSPDGLAEERLGCFEDLADWAVEAGIVPRSEGPRLRRRARTDPRAAAGALRSAHRLRALLQSTFAAAADGRRLPPATLAELNQSLAGALRGLSLAQEAGDWTLALHGRRPGLGSMLPPIVWQAAQLLVSEDRRRLKRCASHHCGWVFLDRSRNGSRRWCDMKVCGNNEKARRFYRRHRDDADEASAAR